MKLRPVGTTFTSATHGYQDRCSFVATRSTASGATTQTRTLTYDNRGFLLTEQLPELGSSGNGTATYSKYDARGHALRIQDALH